MVCSRVSMLWFTAGNRKLTRVSLKCRNHQESREPITGVGGLAGQPCGSRVDHPAPGGREGVQEDIPVLLGVALVVLSLLGGGLECSKS